MLTRDDFTLKKLGYCGLLQADIKDSYSLLLQKILPSKLDYNVVGYYFWRHNFYSCYFHYTQFNELSLPFSSLLTSEETLLATLIEHQTVESIKFFPLPFSEKESLQIPWNNLFPVPEEKNLNLLWMTIREYISKNQKNITEQDFASFFVFFQNYYQTENLPSLTSWHSYQWYNFFYRPNSLWSITKKQLNTLVQSFVLTWLQEDWLQEFFLSTNLCYPEKEPLLKNILEHTLNGFYKKQKQELSLTQLCYAYNLLAEHQHLPGINSETLASTQTLGKSILLTIDSSQKKNITYIHDNKEKYISLYDPDLSDMTTEELRELYHYLQKGYQNEECTHILRKTILQQIDDK